MKKSTITNTVSLIAIAMLLTNGVGTKDGRSNTNPELASPKVKAATKAESSIWDEAQQRGIELFDQDGGKFELPSLNGRHVVYSILHSMRCSPMDIQVQSSIARLRERYPADVVFVSHALDDGKNAPTMLKDYAWEMRENDQRWIFLRGARNANLQLYRMIFGRKDDQFLYQPNVAHIHPKTNRIKLSNALDRKELAGLFKTLESRKEE